MCELPPQVAKLKRKVVNPPGWGPCLTLPGGLEKSATECCYQMDGISLYLVKLQQIALKSIINKSLRFGQSTIFYEKFAAP